MADDVKAGRGRRSILQASAILAGGAAISFLASGAAAAAETPVGRPAFAE